MRPPLHSARPGYFHGLLLLLALSAGVCALAGGVGLYYLATYGCPR